MRCRLVKNFERAVRVTTVIEKTKRGHRFQHLIAFEIKCVVIGIRKVRENWTCDLSDDGRFRILLDRENRFADVSLSHLDELSFGIGRVAFDWDV